MKVIWTDRINGVNYRVLASPNILSIQKWRTVNDPIGTPPAVSFWEWISFEEDCAGLVLQHLVWSLCQEKEQSR